MPYEAQYKKLRNTLKSELRGRAYHKALKCLTFAEKRHTGFRKDLVTREYQHQVEIALFALCLRLNYPEETICVILLHDTPEDKNTDWTVIRSLITGSLPEIFGESADDQAFAKRVLFSLEKITKVYNGVKKPIDLYLKGMEDDPISSIAKLLDRDHNLGTMLGVFSIKKLEEQIEESKLILEMGKEAQELHSEQHEAYEIVKKSIKDKLRMLTAYVDVAKKAKLEK